MPAALDSEVRVPLPDGKSLRAALSLPEEPGVHPGVVVLHEGWGLNDDIRGIAHRFAENGYVAILDTSAQNTPVLFASTNIDVTQDIVKLYDQAYPAKAGAPAATPPTSPSAAPSAPTP